MDGQRFDQLTRTLDAAVSRRRVLGGLLGLAAAAGVARDATAGTTRSCLGPRRFCWKDSQCCSGVCPVGRRVERRVRNRCSCGALATCGRACVDTQSDTQNCGGCGITCPAGWGCTAGVCGCGGDIVPPNSYETTCCEGSWLDPDYDNANCGSCGNVCADDEQCLAGACRTVCTPPTPYSGTCGYAPPPACTIDSAGTIRYQNGISVDVPNVRGCIDDSDVCRDNQFCGVVSVTYGQEEHAWYNATGLCMDLSTICDPTAGD